MKRGFWIRAICIFAALVIGAIPVAGMPLIAWAVGLGFVTLFVGIMADGLGMW